MGLRAFVACIVALIVILLAVNLATPQTPVVAGGVRVMTYNIHHAAGNGACALPATREGNVPAPVCALDLQRIGDIIAGQRPDIVALQEVDRSWARSGGVDQPKELGERLGMNVCFGANQRHGPDDHADRRHEHGVAVLTRFDIVSCDNMFLPVADGEGQRSLLDARVVVDRLGEVAVLNTHFDHEEPATRKMQADAISDYVQEVDVPVVLMGDFYAAPDDGDLAVIKEQLTDAWAVGGDASEGLTYPADPARPAEKRIDYVLVGPGLTVSGADVIGKEQALLSSDHLPVVVDVVFTGEGTTRGATPVT